ncbi:MAG TPA: hypothetical protein VMV46_21580 [Thermoanaerobaculia bacterium]|nr:hypothetical protein [Thermoanaerobaculia bacterium]
MSAPRLWLGIAGAFAVAAAVVLAVLVGQAFTPDLGRFAGALLGVAALLTQVAMFCAWQLWRVTFKQ